MPLILSGNVASATAGAYEVKNSCRFGTDTYMDKDNSASSPTHADKYTISFWCKKCQTSGGASGAPAEDGYLIFSSSGSGTNGDYSDHYCQIYFKNDDDIRWQEYDDGTSGQLETNQVFRDPAAWYHLVFRFDSTDGTADDRMRIYVNGAQVTSFQARTNIDQNTDSWVNYASAGHRIGGGGTRHFDGYLAEFVLVDGQSLAPTEFGEFDEDSPTIWKPKNVSGLTFGTHGYYLDFETSGTLGNDANGGTDFSVTNLAAADQALDSPTNNFCTMNPLANYFPASTFSEGNCKIVTGSSAYTYNIGTFGLTSGKWYWEVKYTAADGDPHNVGHFGISGKGDPIANSHPLGYYSTDYGIHAESGGTITNNNSGTTNSLYNVAIGNVLGFGLDLDSGTKTLKFLVNGVDKIDTTISSSPESGAYFPAFGFTYSAGTGTFEANFGGCSAFTVSSGNSDANGYGNFEYAVPSGYYALCTKNLAEYG